MRLARGGRLGPVLLMGLLIASLVLGILVYRARTPDLALEVVRTDRTAKPGAPAEIVFFVRFSDPEATVEIVGRDKATARTLAPRLALLAGEPVRCAWDGTGDDGERADAGRYRLRVVLPGQGRDMVFPRRLEVPPFPATSDAPVVQVDAGADPACEPVASEAGS